MAASLAAYIVELFVCPPTPHTVDYAPLGLYLRLPVALRLTQTIQTLQRHFLASRLKPGISDLSFPQTCPEFGSTMGCTLIQ